MTDTELKALVASLAIAQAKTDEKLDKLAIAQAKTDEKLDKLATSQAKTDAQMAKTDEKLDKLAIAQAKTDEKLNKIAEQFGNYQNNDASILEYRLYYAFKELIDKDGFVKVKDIAYNRLLSNVKETMKRSTLQYDIVLVNSNHILIIEVKKKAHKKDFDQLYKQEESFKNIFNNQYKDYTFHLGLASEAYYDELINEARAKNIYLFQERSKEIILI